nr:helix-turn-helix domain-containing protein [Chryseobacterium sp. SORGH_AS_1175]
MFLPNVSSIHQAERLYQQLHTTEHTLSQLLDLKSREMEISKEDMAAYLGITVRSLNRALKEIQDNSNAEKEAGEK